MHAYAASVVQTNTTNTVQEIKLMKKAYTAPKLTNHGNVESLTQAFGSSPAADVVYIGGSNVPTNVGSTGSVDGIIVIK
ncbi:lasso peptide [Leptolyngbya sp. AN02str]|uniref:lasso peptide n=1 Tax=Leptolyngbya sp. AN02str TaxID=3423363 RepID=UPI003D320635